MGCAMGDPYVKLDRAAGLLGQNRPIPAEPLIRQAMAEYEKQNNPLGIGLAHQDYGILLTLARLPPHFSQYGFMDKSVTLDNRLVKGAEYFNRSLEYFRLAGQQDLAADNYAHLYFAYFNMAITYRDLGERAQACAWMAKSLDAADANDRRTPQDKVSKSHRDRMRAFPKDNACDRDPAATTGSAAGPANVAAMA
jgi:hypothetical protein